MGKFPTGCFLSPPKVPPKIFSAFLKRGGLPCGVWGGDTLSEGDATPLGFFLQKNSGGAAWGIKERLFFHKGGTPRVFRGRKTFGENIMRC